MRIHFVSVTVCQGRAFPKDESEKNMQCYVKLHLVGATSRKGRTNVRKDRGERPIWNQRFDFSFKEDLTKEHLNRPMKLVLQAYDRDLLSRDDLLGQTTVDLSPHFQENELERGKQFWVELMDKDGKTTGGAVQIQLVCKVLNDDDKNKQSIKYMQYTHLLKVGVKQGEGLACKDVLGQGDPYVELKLGETTLRTQPASGKNPLWNQTTYFWLNQPEQERYSLVVGVFDHDKMGRDLIGEGSLNLRALFLKVEEDTAWGGEEWVPLRATSATDDAQLTDLKAHAASHHEEGAIVSPVPEEERAGRVLVRLELRGREQVERDFFLNAVTSVNALIKDDAEVSQEELNTLSKSDVAWILSTMGGDASDQVITRLFQEFDLDQSGTIDQEEFSRYLSSSRAQEVSTQRLLTMLESDADNAAESALMEPVEFSKEEGQILIKDLETGVIVHEEIPTYIKAGIKAMSCTNVSRAFIAKSRRYMIHVSKQTGKKFDDPKSVKAIPDFVRIHHIQTEDLELALPQFKTFNDFFARRLKPGARPIAEPENGALAVSPADCRMTVFPTLSVAQDLWIKGQQFTVESLLGPLAGEYGAMFTNAALCIARLAPQDYHCWHLPVPGTLGKALPILDGALYTVNPIAVNKDVNVYTENKRCVVPIHTEHFGTVILIAVGALMVGSWELELHEGEQAPKGVRHGSFRYGGSTVLLLFQHGTIEFNERILRNSMERIETLVRVGIPLGTATHKSNPKSGLNPGSNNATNLAAAKSSPTEENPKADVKPTEAKDKSTEPEVAENKTKNEPAPDSCCVLS